MPKLPAKDGGHTAFTNHRIMRKPGSELETVQPDTLRAWREPERSLQDRNLALALVTAGLQNQSPSLVIRGYRMMNRLEKYFPNDPSLLTTLGTVLMKGKQPAEALKRFEKAIALKPDYAPFYVELAARLAVPQMSRKRRRCG